MNESILIVEDEIAIVMMLKVMLQKTGFTIWDSTPSGEEAIEKIKLAAKGKNGNLPSLILMDIHLTGMTGTQTVKVLHSEGFHMPVIFLTAYDDSDTRKEAVSTEPYAFLTKPPNEKELKMAIELALQKESKRVLEKDKYYVESIIRSMIDTLIVITHNGVIKTVNQATCTLLGYKESELIEGHVSTIWHEKTIELEEIIAKGSLRNIKMAYLSKTGKNIPVLFSASVMRDNSGGIQGIVCVARDITEQIEMEHRLQESLKQKEMLLSEIHHRVKNNMQVISSLLGLHSLFIEDNVLSDIIDDSRKRIKSMALIHEKLYSHKDFSGIDFKEYLETLSGELLKACLSADNISMIFDIEGIFLGIDTAIPLGLILNELITNSLKYAFPDNIKGTIHITLNKQGENDFELIYKDNGVGIPDNINPEKPKTLGLHLVRTFVRQLKGGMQVRSSEGTEFIINFPVTT